MNNDYLEDQRHGAREPRSKLLPPYLAGNPYFKDFADAIDKVWAEQVDQRIDVIKYLRNMWVTNPTVEQKIDNGEMINLEDWTRPERSILVKQVNLLGMKLKSAGLLTDQNYLTVSRFLGLYWFGKGTEDFIQFINFALILDLEVSNLWSERQHRQQLVHVPVKVHRDLRLHLAYSQAASGYVRVNGVLIGTFYDAPPNQQIPVTWNVSEFTPTGTNRVVVTDTSGNWDDYQVEIELFSPISLTYQYPLLDVPTEV